jgi:hypothetical protein
VVAVVQLMKVLLAVQAAAQAVLLGEVAVQPAVAVEVKWAVEHQSPLLDQHCKVDLLDQKVMAVVLVAVVADIGAVVLDQTQTLVLLVAAALAISILPL